MQIQKISFMGLFNKDKTHEAKHLKSNEAQTKPSKTDRSQNIYYTDLVIHKRDRYTYVDFKKVGGVLNYETAYIDKTPYSGSLTIKYADFGIKSYYTKGVKDNVEVKEGDANSVFFYKHSTKEHKDGHKTIKYVSQNYQHEYTENYDENGKLCQTKIEHFIKDKLKSSTLTTYDEDGHTILGQKTVFHNDYSDNGIKTIESEYKEGKLIRKNIKGELDTNNRKTNSVIIEFDENETPLFTEEYKPRFYDNTDGEKVYATAYKTVTSPKTKKTISYRYKTLDYTVGINPLRKELFEESINTTRIETPKGNVYYIDGITNEPLAVEYYENDGKILTKVENKTNNTTASVKPMGSNALIATITDDETKKTISNLYFRKSDNQWILNGKDEFDENGTKIQIEKINRDGSSIITNKNPDEE